MIRVKLKSIDQFISRHGVTMHRREVEKRPDRAAGYGWMEGVRHFLCVLRSRNNPGKSMVIYYSQGPGIETEPETRDVLNCVAKGDYALLDYFVLAILLFFAFGGSAFASSQLTPISRHEVSNGVGRIFPMYHGPSAAVFFSKNVLVIDSSKKHLAYKSAVTNMPIWHRMIGGSEIDHRFDNQWLLYREQLTPDYFADRFFLYEVFFRTFSPSDFRDESWGSSKIMNLHNPWIIVFARITPSTVISLFRCGKLFWMDWLAIQTAVQNISPFMGARYTLLLRSGKPKGASESGYYNCGDSSNENAIFIKEGAFASGEEPSVWTEAPWHYWMRFFSFIGFAIIGVIGFALLKRR